MTKRLINSDFFFRYMLQKLLKHQNIIDSENNSNVADFCNRYVLFILACN